MRIILALPRAARLSIFLLEKQKCGASTRDLIKDTPLIGKKKALHLMRFKPTTSLSRGVRSIAAQGYDIILGAGLDRKKERLVEIQVTDQL